MDKKTEYNVARQMVERALGECFTENVPQKVLLEAMRYSLLAGGKRVRPVLVLKFAQAVGGNMEMVLPVACGIEMIHTYSLIHDDLPCMDNDTLRRGKPTNHVVYGECLATLAGDALQAAAFSTLLSAPLPAERTAAAAKTLACAAGGLGMCGGQTLDMDGETRTLSLQDISQIHELKTAALIKAAAEMGVIAGGGSQKQREAAVQYADALGLAFQIRDDILDNVSTEEELGKPIGSDDECGKSTFVSLLGLKKCEELVAKKTEEAKKAIENVIDNSEFFCWLADELAKRRS